MVLLGESAVFLLLVTGRKSEETSEISSLPVSASLNCLHLRIILKQIPELHSQYTPPVVAVVIAQQRPG